MNHPDWQGQSFPTVKIAGENSYKAFSTIKYGDVHQERAPVSGPETGQGQDPEEHLFPSL